MAYQQDKYAHLYPRLSLIRRLEVGMIASGIPYHTQRARRWLAGKIQEIGGRMNVPQFIAQQTADKKIASQAIQGKLIFFYYDAKTKAKLPFWDKFPLVLPIEKYPDGFLGLNFHYLPMKYRAKLLDALLTNLNNAKMDDSTKFRVNYNLLKNTAKYWMFKPTLKRYLTAHIRSKIITVTPDQWEIAIFLPAERFQKKSKDEVWKDSINTLEHN